MRPHEPAPHVPLRSWYFFHMPNHQVKAAAVERLLQFVNASIAEGKMSPIVPADDEWVIPEVIEALRADGWAVATRKWARLTGGQGTCLDITQADDEGEDNDEAEDTPSLKERVEQLERRVKALEEGRGR